jgi:hypothetical protein
VISDPTTGPHARDFEDNDAMSLPLSRNVPLLLGLASLVILPHL